MHAPLTVGFGTLFPAYDLLIKSWKEILMAVALLLLLVDLYRKEQLWPSLKDRLIQIAAAYAAVHLLCLALVPTGAKAAIAGLLIDLRYILFFVLVYIAFKVYPGYRKLFLKVGLVGAAIVVGFATVQLFLPADSLKYIGYGDKTIQPYLTVDKNPQYIRVNSTLRGPNPLGAYVAIVIALLVAVLVRGKLYLKDKKIAIGVGLLALCSGIALWISYSRSAFIAVAVVALLTAIATARRLSRRAWIASVVVLFALLGGLIATWTTPFVTNVVLHENPNGGSSISSNEGHVESLEYGIAKVITQPFGSGIGSTGSASLLGDNTVVIENQYLFIAHESGWLGLGLFAVFFGLVMVRLWRQRQDWLSLGVFTSGIGLAIIGLLLPVWADDTVAIVWWGLAAIALGEVYAKQSTKQKTT